MALTKAIEKENTIDDLKVDLDKLMGKYEVLETERDKLSMNVIEYQQCISELQEELGKCYDIIDSKDKELIQTLEKQKQEFLTT